MVHVRGYIYRIRSVCSCVYMHIPRTWSNQRLVESSKLNICRLRSSLYAYKHGRDMQTARFSRCLIRNVIQVLCIYLKHYAPHVHKEKFSGYKSACEYVAAQYYIKVCFQAVLLQMTTTNVCFSACLPCMKLSK